MRELIVKSMNRFFHEFGSICLFVATIVKTVFCTRGNAQAILAQISSVSYRSVSTVAFAGIFVGAILVLQFHRILVQYDGEIFLGGLNTSAVVREVGPLLISFLLAGKIGAFTAAELGTMRVTEQIDAIQCLGTNPIQYLIVPRWIAIIISSVILLVIGLVISIGGSMLVSNILLDINPLQFASSIGQFTDLSTVASGIFKSAVYGTIVASVSCYEGYTASGGARGVGKAVTQAAVYINLYIIIANTLTSNMFEFLQDVLVPFIKGAW